MPIHRRAQLGTVLFAIAGIAMVAVLIAAVRESAPVVRLGWLVLALVACSAGIFMRAWSYRPEEVKPPVPLAKLYPPRRKVKDRNGL